MGEPLDRKRAFSLFPASLFSTNPRILECIGTMRFFPDLVLSPPRNAPACRSMSLAGIRISSEILHPEYMYIRTLSTHGLSLFAHRVSSSAAVNGPPGASSSWTVMAAKAEYPELGVFFI